MALVASVTAVYVLLFVRGLGWQWSVSVRPPGDLPAPVSAAPVEAVSRGAAGSPSSGSRLPAPGAGGAGSAERGTAPRVGGTAPAANAKTALPASDEPPPRDVVDSYGVYYDALGVAVTGIDADPGGVYNVAPNRQVRIGGPRGSLYDVQPGGKLTVATRVKEWPAVGG